MKRVLSSILVLLMCASLFACAPKATTEPAAEATAAQDQAAGTEATEAPAEDTATTTFGLKPFAERQTLRIGFFTGSPLSYPFLFADKMGYFDELNIDVEYVGFTGGPAMIEAYKEWDIASCGEGGLCIAMKKSAEFGLKIIDITDYEENLALFARAGSKLAEDPTNPENWKGTEWVYPTGTTAQAVLVNALAKLGLTLNDIKSTNMDNASSLTGFNGGTGDGLGCWNAIAFAAEDAGYVRIGDAGTLGFKAPCGTVATNEILDTNLELVTDACILFHRMVEWCYASDENMAKAAEWYLEDCENEGMLVTPDTAARVMDWYRGPTTKEWIDLFSVASADDAALYTSRDLLQAEKDILVGLDFFIGEGKYTPEDRISYLDAGVISNVVANNAKTMLDTLGLAY